MKREDSIHVATTGFTVATSGTTASQALPNTSDGTKPRYVRVASVNSCYIKLGVAAVTATTNDMLIQPADSLILAVGGNTHIAYIQDTAGAKLNVQAMEDL